ncbi:hypothetical protein WN944_017127 [Citrus x changshan-huyou]|uniref:Uncharacterized protein n=1 Tax=Citrus x changshan-huyou TaxID=2935761 RepID=A0AAP0QKY8_9ROSI
MQSRLATAAGRSCWVFSTSRNKCLRREFVAAAASTGRTTDPAIHSGEVEKGPDVHYDEPLGSSNEAAVAGNNPKNKETDTDPLVPPNPPHSSTKAEALGEVICAAVDGTPLSNDIENEQRDKHEKVESDKEYFGHNKASPLSEIEMADTRKPITRATDGTADAVGSDVIGWRPEQLDTAEEALRRGAEIFRQNAMRGDPEVFPHSRVLRELRGEWF